MSHKIIKTPREAIEKKANELGISFEELLELESEFSSFSDKVESNNERLRSLCQMGGKLTGPALGEWMQLMSKVNPEWTHQNAKRGRAKLQEKLDNDPEFYADWCDSKSKGALRFKEEYPELFEEYQKLRMDTVMQWRIDNPEEHAKNFANFQAKGQARAKELECWKIGWEVAHKRYKEWQQTEDYLRWKEERSEWLSNQRKDPNSEFNINMRKGLAESEAKRKSELENIKLATEAAHYEVICPKCGKPGDAVVMSRHHFDKCTFNQQLELKVIKGISDKHIFRNQKEIQEIFLKAGFKSNYYFKYDIFDKYFLKLDPSKKTSGFCVLNTFDFDAYYLDLEHKEIERKAKVLEGQRQRARNMAEKRKGTKHSEESKNKIRKAIKNKK